VGMLAKIRRMHFRDGMSLREVARRTGLSRNTVRGWLRRPAVVEPKYPARRGASKLDGWAELLATWLKTDSHRGRRERRTATVLFAAVRALGYSGGYGRVSAFVRRWKAEEADSPRRAAYVPLVFELGEAFQFDWSCEYAFVGGLRRRLELAHVKLAASRAFWLVAYPSQGHEMLFDAHASAFAAFGGIPRRGIYDNMKTAVDRVGRGKERTVNARFQAMCSHYLFEPEFCNRAAGWEKGIVEKNVQDRRRQIWREALERRWASLAELNGWLAGRCRAAWQEMRHPQ
jgi:transposase